MKQFLTSHDIANQVRMMHPVFHGSFILVEGDTDARMYKRFVDTTRCRIIPAHGKSNALSALEMLEASGFPGILTIVDSDFWELDGTEPPNRNVMVTDTHDLETMIVSSRALDVVLDEFGSARKMKLMGTSVRQMLLKVAVPIGFIRWISSSKQENLSLRFKDMSLAAVIEIRGKTMRTDIDALLKELKSHSRNTPFDKRVVKIRLKKLLRDNRHDPWHVCRGHDVVHILTIGLRDVFGNRHAKSITYEQIDRILRIAYGYAEFSQTKLYTAIKRWEETNPGFTVLAGFVVPVNSKSVSR